MMLQFTVSPEKREVSQKQDMCFDVQDKINPVHPVNPVQKKIADLLRPDFFAEHKNNTTRYLHQDQKNNRKPDTP